MVEYSRSVLSMRAKIIGVSVTVLVCWACYLLALRGLRSHSGVVPIVNQNTQVAERTPQAEMEFHLMDAGEGEISGMDTSFQSYESSDGVEVLFLTRTLSSADRAQKELQKTIETATRIIEKGVKRDRDGRVIGERAVILFSDGTKTDNERAAVWWTRKSDLLAIEAKSMDHVLAFEKKYCR
jgi:hypothetical protein